MKKMKSLMMMQMMEKSHIAFFFEPLLETDATVFMNEEIKKIPNEETLNAEKVAEEGPRFF